MLETKTGVLTPFGTTNVLPARANHEARSILGIKVCVFSKTDALDHLSFAIEQKHHVKLAFLNAHGANIAQRDRAYKNDLEKFDVLADGVGVDIGSIINYGEKFPENLNGTDFIPALFAHLTQGAKIALFGSEPGVAEFAVENLQARFPAHQFKVAGHGFLSRSAEKKMLKHLAETQPDILLVALGNPAQERWIAEHCSKDNCTIAIGVGAFFDFAADSVPRAPEFIRKFRLEWAYRLWQEPRRMWKRYLIGNPLFILRSLMQKFSRNG